MKTEFVAVEVFEEGTPVFQLLESEKLADGIYRLGYPPFAYDPEDLVLEFPPGAAVRVATKELFDGPHLVAVELVDWPEQER